MPDTPPSSPSVKPLVPPPTTGSSASSPPPASPAGKSHGSSGPIFHIILIVLLAIGFGALYFKLDGDTAALKTALTTTQGNMTTMSSSMMKLDERMMKVEEGMKKDVEEKIAKKEEKADWIESTEKFYTLTFSYPSEFFVKRFGGFADNDTLSVQNSSLTMALNSATGCEPNETCTKDGLQITVTEYFPQIKDVKLPDKYAYTSTSNQAIKKADISNYCADADGPCFPPKALYYFTGQKGIYEINVYEKNYVGDSTTIIDGFLIRLHE